MDTSLKRMIEIFDLFSDKLDELSQKREKFIGVLPNYENLVTELVDNVSTIIVEKSEENGYHPVVKFNSLLLDKKIIIIPQHFEEIHKDCPEIEYYNKWRTTDDEEQYLHWGNCFPKGERRNILLQQVEKIDKDIVSLNPDNDNDSEKIQYYKCLFPDFTGLKNEKDIKTTIKERIADHSGYIEELQTGIYKYFHYEKIKTANRKEIIDCLFEPAVVLGWKSLFTITHENAGIEFIENQYIPSLYLCKEEEIDIKKELEVLKEIDDLYYDAVRRFLLLEQKFVFDYLNISDIHNRAWNTINDTLDKGVFDRYRVLPSSVEDKEDKEIDNYKEDIKNVLRNIHGHFDDFCRKRNIWLIINYCSLFLKDQISDYSLEDFEDIQSIESFCKKIKALKWKDSYFNSPDNSINWLNGLLRYKRLYDEWPDKNTTHTIEYLSEITNEYRKNDKNFSVFPEEDQEKIKRFNKRLNKLLVEENFPDETPITNVRFNALRTPSVSIDVKELKPNRLSWYGIFGTINDDIALRMTKTDETAYETITEESGSKLIYKNIFNLKIPKGDGIKIDKSNNQVIDAKAVVEKYKKYIENSFKNALCNFAHLSDTKGKQVVSNASEEDIAKELFQNKNIKEWEECLIYSKKYRVEFADSLDFFPNILFFKENKQFSDEDVLFCRILSILYAKIITKLFILENDILLNRLEDLVDSKPQRIFDKDNIIKLREEVQLNNYQAIVEKIFNHFISSHLRKLHPVIRNDLLIAYYLYWTDYFRGEIAEQGINLLWTREKLRNDYKQWENTYYLPEIKKNINGDYKINFNLKNFYYAPKGEKSPLEMTRLNDDEFTFFVKSLTHEKDTVEEFSTITIGDLSSIEDQEEKGKYYSYLKKKLIDILDEMNLEGEKRKSLEKDVGDGEGAANYLSLFCSNKMRDIKYKYIYYIPSVNHDGGSYGGFSFFCKNKWSRSITKAAQDWATRFGATFAEIEATKIVEREITTHASKAAMTAIMSRNQSHNIGSHVISYWNQSIEEKLKDIPGNYDNTQEALKKSKDLFQYIQHRMDFLAEISTSVPCSELSLDIEQDILNPYFIKPNDDKFKTKLQNGGDISVLLEGIAKSEGINLHNKIILDTTALEDKSKRVSIPNGLIGNHAIYSILENFIRNAAKHYKGTTISDHDNLEDAKLKAETIQHSMKFYFQDQMNDISYSNINEFTNKEEVTKYVSYLHEQQNMMQFIKIVIKKPENPLWQNDYIVMRIWDMRENSCSRETVDKLRTYLPRGQNYKFTDKGNLMPGAWGIKEMVTSANFLRKNKTDFLLKGYDDNEPDLLDILCGDNMNGGLDRHQCCLNADWDMTNLCRKVESGYRNRFGIRLYLRKPKDLAVAVESITEDKIKKDKFGIEKKEPQEYNIPLKEEIPHRMLLVENDDIKKGYKNDPKAPCRIMVYKNDINNGGIDDDYYLCLYEEFIKEEINSDAFKYSLVNDLEESYNFADTQYSVNDAPSHDQINNYLYFASHPEKGNFKFNDRFNKNHYFQPISGGYSTKAKLHNNKKLPECIRSQFYLELIESAYTKVVIVDERISEWGKKNTAYNNKTVSEILKKMGIYIVDINLNNVTCEALTGMLLKEDRDFPAFNEVEEKNAHFFVIHQGVLDKLDKDADRFMVHIKCRWKIVDSGRGVPSDLYKDARFVEISALQKMIENYDKHGLVQTLFSLRRPPTEDKNRR